MNIKNKKSNKRRIITLLLMMLFTIVLLSSSTYAWFTANKVVTVSPIQVNVAAEGGIQVSADGTNWRAVIGISDLIAAENEGINLVYDENVNQIPTVLKPVSTVKTVDSTGKMEMYLGTVTSNVGGDYILSTVQETEVRGENGNFVAFDLFIKSDVNTNLYLTPNSQITTSDAINTGIKNAARVAFVILGNTPIGSAVETIQDLNAGVTAPVYLWEPNYDVHTAQAVSNAYDTYGITTTTTGGSALAYSGVATEILEADDLELGLAVGTTSYVTAITPNYTTIESFATSQQVFSLTAGITKVRFYMWLEGQDVDCENHASGGSATFNVQFSTDAS